MPKLHASLSLLSLFAIALGCADSAPYHTQPEPPGRDYEEIVALGAAPRERPVLQRSVILVVVDGVRAREMFGGADRNVADAHGMWVRDLEGGKNLAPNLHRLAAQGVAVGAGLGEPMKAGSPNPVSIPGYVEIFGGNVPLDCEHNTCPPVASPTILDRVSGAFGSVNSALFASWEPVERAAVKDPSAIVASVGRSTLRQSEMLSKKEPIWAAWQQGNASLGWPGDHEDYRPDVHTAAVALKYLRTYNPRFMAVVLGDADEFGHRNDYAGYLGSIQAADRFLGELSVTLSEMGANDTVVIVTTDHGRSNEFADHGADFPESQYVWMVAFGADMPHRGVVAAETGWHLANVHGTVLELLGLRTEGDPLPIREVFDPPAR